MASTQARSYKNSGDEKKAHSEGFVSMPRKAETVALRRSESVRITMRHLQYAAGIVCRTAGLLLLATAAILWLRGRPATSNLFAAGGFTFIAGMYLKRRSSLRTCFMCRAKSDRHRDRCPACGSEFAGNPFDEISEPFYK